MKSIKTSKTATHYCRLLANGAINNPCEKQCSGCLKTDSMEEELN
ncbi:hypothetical protein [Gaetbulibacter sp. PBL-D1]